MHYLHCIDIGHDWDGTPISIRFVVRSNFLHIDDIRKSFHQIAIKRYVYLPELVRVLNRLYI